jgi:hypothetical protein
MEDFLSGASAVAAAAIALFFLRFWRETGDRFFVLFAIAFAIFAVNRCVLAALDDEDEARTVVYVVRALAFGVIIVAIVDKNRPVSRH